MLHPAQYPGWPTGKASSSLALATPSVPSGAPHWWQLVTPNYQPGCLFQPLAPYYLAPGIPFGIPVYLVTKKQYISPMGFPLINYPTLSRSLKSASPLYQLWYSKFVSGHSATGWMMYLWGKWDTAQCPCCHHDPETTLLRYEIYPIFINEKMRK